MACQGTYSTKRLTPSPSCLAVCSGCTFQSSVQVNVIEDGCQFLWSVTPSGCGSSGSSGTENLACPQNKTLTFYCDAGGACPAFELRLMCGPEPA